MQQMLRSLVVREAVLELLWHYLARVAAVLCNLLEVWEELEAVEQPLVELRLREPEEWVEGFLPH